MMARGVQRGNHHRKKMWRGQWPWVRRRTYLSGCYRNLLRLAKGTGYNSHIDGDFARDLEEIINSHREPPDESARMG